MKEVVNHRQLAYLIQRVLRELSEKHELDVCIIEDIIKDYCEVLEENVRTVIVVSEN